MLRVDFEDAPSARVLRDKLARFDELLPAHDVIVMSDYSKGGLAHVHADDREGARGRQAGAGRSEGRRLRALSRRDDAHAERAELREVVGSWKTEED